jgi:hypothetical protein
MAHTTFSNYTDDELLRLVDDKRHRSPLIDELCTRLEARGDVAVQEDANAHVECPVCAAPLQAGYDSANNMFTIANQE